MSHTFLAYNKSISSEMIKFFSAYTDVEAGVPYTPSYHNSEENKKYIF
jgi:hypothetical protein